MYDCCVHENVAQCQIHQLPETMVSRARGIVSCGHMTCARSKPLWWPWNGDRRCRARHEKFVLHHHELQDVLRPGLREDGDDGPSNSSLLPRSEKPGEVDVILLDLVHHLCGQARRQLQGEATYTYVLVGSMKENLGQPAFSSTAIVTEQTCFRGTEDETYTRKMTNIEVG